MTRPKVVVPVLLVAIVASALVYELAHTKYGLAILTAPPPGIPGPYYVTAEAEIYGPVVDLASIKNKTGGQYADDFTYVQWGTNPFYRVYVDNTLQEVCYGTMTEMLERFDPHFEYAQEHDLLSMFTNLGNLGGVDPSSVLGNIKYFGSFQGTIIGVSDSTSFNVTAHSLKAVLAAGRAGWYFWWGYHVQNSQINIRMNDSTMISFTATAWSDPNTAWSTSNVNGSGYGFDELYCLQVEISRGSPDGDGTAVFYLDSITHYELTSYVPFRAFNVTELPGTGYITKHISPSSPIVNSRINVTVQCDPPAAMRMNISDCYPATFAWSSVDVLLQKYRVGVGLEDSEYVNVVPTLDGSNMKFTVYYNQAPNILESLQSDEYVYLTYSLRVPSDAGEYTLPSATMAYSIPLPQTGS